MQLISKEGIALQIKDLRDGGKKGGGDKISESREKGNKGGNKGGREGGRRSSYLLAKLATDTGIKPVEEGLAGLVRRA